MKQTSLSSIFCIAILLIYSSISFADPVTIRIHCWEGYSKPYTDNFIKLIKKKYNKDILISITNSSDPVEFWNLSRGKKVDIISPAHNLLKSKNEVFISEGVVLPLNLKNIPNYKYVISILQKNEFVSKNNKIYGVPYTMGGYSLAYNTEKVKRPDSWNVLFQDENINKYTISKDYPDCNIYITALVSDIGYSSLYDFNEIIKKTPLAEFQKKLNKLSVNSYSLWVGTANYKEFPNLSYAATWCYAVAKANMAGGKWEIATPVEGSTMWVDHWAVTSAVENNSEKKLFCEEWINYCLSPELQVGVIRNWGVSPVVSNIKSFLTADEIKTFKVGDEQYWQTLSLWKNQSFNTINGFKGIWSRALKERNQQTKSLSE